MNSSLKKTSKKLTIAIIIMSLFLLVSLFPLWGVLDRTNNQQKEKETYLSSFEEKREALSDLKKRYKEASQISEKLYQALPEKKEVSTLISSFYVLENKAGIKITNIKFGEENKRKKDNKDKNSPLSQTSKEEDLYTLPIEIELEGSYQNLYLFIQSLQNNTRYIKINKIKTEAIIKTPGSDAINATLNVIAYLKP